MSVPEKQHLYTLMDQYLVNTLNVQDFCEQYHATFAALSLESLTSLEKCVLLDFDEIVQKYPHSPRAAQEGFYDFLTEEQLYEELVRTKKLLDKKTQETML